METNGMNEQGRYQLSGEMENPGMAPRAYTGAIGSLLSPPSGPLVCAALVKAQQEAGSVGKDAKNSFHNYAYASSEAIIEEGRRALASADLAIFPASHDRDPNKPEHSWMGEGDAAFIDAPRRVRTVYWLIHSSGERMEIVTTAPVIPEKGRPEDKAEFGARTENLAYALRDLLLLPRVNVETPSGRDDRDKPLRGQAPAKPSTQPPAKRQESAPPKAQTPAASAPPAAVSAPAMPSQASLPAATGTPSVSAPTPSQPENGSKETSGSRIDREPESITAEQDVEIGALFKKAKMSRVAVTDWITKNVNPKGPAFLSRADGDVTITKLKAMLGDGQ